MNPAQRLFTGLPWAAATALAVALITLYPALPGSDDALFLSRGVQHFSVLEFAPNFPGYPGLIWLARLLKPVTDSPFAALQLVSLMGSLALGCVAGRVYHQVTQDRIGGALLAGLILSMPLTSQVALSGLSDGPGLCLFFLAWWLMLNRAGTIAGLTWGLGWTVRPSYALLWLAQAASFCRLSDWPWRRFAIAVALMALAALAFVWQADGWGYFLEGLRFVQGHFLIWGEAAGARDDHTSWLNALQASGVQGASGPAPSC